MFDSSNEGFRNWEFMTVHFWGERAEGTWTLEIIDSLSKLRNPEVLGKVKKKICMLRRTFVFRFTPVAVLIQSKL